MPSLRTVLALTVTAAAAVVVPAATAVAAPPPGQSAADALPTDGLTSAVPTEAVLSAVPTRSVTGALGSGIAPVRNLTLDPLSNTGVDPLDNGVGSQVADFPALSTTLLTDPVTHGGSLATLPLSGATTSLLPH